MDGAVAAFQRRCAARAIDNPPKSAAPLLLAYHRDMFNAALDKPGLTLARQPPARKRDLAVLRHISISFRLLHGASIYEVAANCRTSAHMISEHDGKWVGLRMMKGLNVLKRQPSGEE
jgi:hypothetical protein